MLGGMTAKSAPDDADEVRRRELADFLRSRRERVTPDQVGLPAGRRRRTPGLRREEVAQLSAVGVTWYTWLEQARDIQVSAQVLDSIARALMLDPPERAHLFVLAGVPDPTPGRECPYVTPSLLATMQELEPLPACVMNSRYDILAYNRTYRFLVRDLDAVPADDRNLLWLLFQHPAWRTSVVDHEAVVRRCTGLFRAAMAEHVGEPLWKLLLKRMQTSAEFRELWERHEIVQPSDTSKGFVNERVGMLRLQHTSLWLTQRGGSRMVVYTPLDQESRLRLERLHALGGAAAATERPVAVAV
jgi:hypothetical protein